MLCEAGLSEGHPPARGDGDSDLHARPKLDAQVTLQQVWCSLHCSRSAVHQLQTNTVMRISEQRVYAVFGAFGIALYIGHVAEKVLRNRSSFPSRCR